MAPLEADRRCPGEGFEGECGLCAACAESVAELAVNHRRLVKLDERPKGVMRASDTVCLDFKASRMSESNKVRCRSA